ncbi:MAG: hypothetical protein ACK5LR_11725 [Mangrovibacterium sp.]
MEIKNKALLLHSLLGITDYQLRITKRQTFLREKIFEKYFFKKLQGSNISIYFAIRFAQVLILSGERKGNSGSSGESPSSAAKAAQPKRTATLQSSLKILKR